MSTNEHVILVDHEDQPLGTEEKLKAHIDGHLHRAFSVFLFDQDGSCLLQKRAMGKYHSGGLWSNACCSHPRPGETIEHAVARRMQDELGLSCSITKILEVAYDLDAGAGLREAEYNHTFMGSLDSSIAIPFSKDEMSEVAWWEIDDIKHGLVTTPDQYTSWFHLLFPKVMAVLSNRKA